MTGYYDRLDCLHRSTWRQEASRGKTVLSSAHWLRNCIDVECIQWLPRKSTEGLFNVQRSRNYHQMTPIDLMMKILEVFSWIRNSVRSFFIAVNRLKGSETIYFHWDFLHRSFLCRLQLATEIIFFLHLPRSDALVGLMGVSNFSSRLGDR